MVNIWFVVYVFAHLLSWAGPFPLMEDCDQAAMGFKANWPDKPDAVQARCEERVVPPKVGEPLPMEL